MAWAVRARCLALLGDRAEAVAAARRGAALANETSRALLGAWCVGVLAWVADDPAERRSALDMGEAMLADRVVGHCHLWFYRDAIEACLRAGDPDAVDHYADLLREFTASEPLPWSDFFIARGQALAAHARSPHDHELRERLLDLKGHAERVRMGTALPAITRALAMA